MRFALALLLIAACPAPAVELALAGDPDGIEARPLPRERLWVGLRHRALAGLSLRWREHGATGTKPVAIEARGVPPGSAPATRWRRFGIAGGGFAASARWLHAVRRDGDVTTVEVDVSARHTTELLWVDLTSYRDWARPARLVSQDEEPLGERQPLVLVHGLLWASPDGAFSPLMDGLFTRTLRRHPAWPALSRRYKLFAFEYPSFAGSPAAGRALVNAVRALYPGGEVPANRVVLAGHSTGGLVVRHAMNTDGFGECVDRAFAIATAHHGTLVASLAPADHRLAGVFAGTSMLREVLGRLVPACPGLDELAWDGHGGALVDPALQSIGVRINHERAAFNLTDRYLDRLVAIAGDCPRLDGPLDRVRRLQAALGGPFANCDPLVPFASSTFEGATIQRAVRRGVAHGDWALEPGALDALVARLEHP